MKDFPLKQIQDGKVLIVGNQFPEVFKLSMRNDVYLCKYREAVTVVATLLENITGAENYEFFTFNDNEEVVSQAINFPLNKGATVKFNLTMANNTILSLDDGSSIIPIPVLSGNAEVADVITGKTFYSDSLIRLTGTLETLPYSSQLSDSHNKSLTDITSCRTASFLSGVVQNSLSLSIAPLNGKQKTLIIHAFVISNSNSGWEIHYDGVNQTTFTSFSPVADGNGFYCGDIRSVIIPVAEGTHLIEFLNSSGTTIVIGSTISYELIQI